MAAQMRPHVEAKTSPSQGSPGVLPASLRKLPPTTFLSRPYAKLPVNTTSNFPYLAPPNRHVHRRIFRIIPHYNL